MLEKARKGDRRIGEIKLKEKELEAKREIESLRKIKLIKERERVEEERLLSKFNAKKLRDEKRIRLAEIKNSKYLSIVKARELSRKTGLQERADKKVARDLIKKRNGDLNKERKKDKTLLISKKNEELRLKGIRAQISNNERDYYIKKKWGKVPGANVIEAKPEVVVNKLPVFIGETRTVGIAERIIQKEKERLNKEVLY